MRLPWRLGDVRPRHAALPDAVRPVPRIPCAGPVPRDHEPDAGDPLARERRDAAGAGVRAESGIPNAKVIVQRDELAAMADLHPLQKPWYQPDTYRDIAPDAFLPIDGSVILGPHHTSLIPQEFS